MLQSAFLVYRGFDTKAASALRDMPWAQARPRPKEDAKQWARVAPTLRPLVVAFHATQRHVSSSLRSYQVSMWTFVLLHERKP